MFETLPLQPADSLLALIKAFAADPRPNRIDLGVGVYRDEQGRTPVMAAIKAAEEALLAGQESKSYLGPEGDPAFVAALAPVVFGAGQGGLSSRLSGVQTPGGSGALRLAAELIAAARPQARLLMATPTWPNHKPIFEAAGVPVLSHRGFDLATQTLRLDETLAAIAAARPGDAILLHACCNNPTGADPDPAQWVELAAAIAAAGLMLVLDIAYQGLGDGLEDDAQGLRTVLAAVPEALVASSCNKNFAMYRDRVGALFALGRSADEAGRIASHMAALARVNWSMPPDHGAAAVRLVLSTPALHDLWREELDRMRSRVRSVRAALAAADAALGFVAGQKGLFSNFELRPDEVEALRRDEAIYLAPSGRANLAGMRAEDAATVAAALRRVRERRGAARAA